MLYHEFREYLDKNSGHSIDLFIEKARDYQNEKNKKRPKDKRWNETKLQKVVLEMLDQPIDGTYKQIKAQKGVSKYNGVQIWIEFMNEHEFLNIFANNIAEMEFE